jgi:hypothetical protein
MKNTKKNLIFLITPILLLLISISLSSCSDDDKEEPTPPYSCDTCVNTPDALPENDHSVKGIYKGIEVGSSGTLSIDIQNGSNTITGIMTLDGITANLTSTVIYENGQPYVAPFTGTYDGNAVTITFSVELGGGAPTVISSDIPGHPDAVFTVYKETSTSLIEAFEGTYSKSGGGTGTFNILLSRALELWGGVAKDDGPGATVDEIDGTINANDQLVETESGTVVGTLTGDEIHGQFQDSDNTTITVTGHRTL